MYNSEASAQQPLNLDSLRLIIKECRVQLGMTQEAAAERSDVTIDEWKNLESGAEGGRRRTSIRLPKDLPMLNRVARAIGKQGARELLEEAGVL